MNGSAGTNAPDTSPASAADTASLRGAAPGARSDYASSASVKNISQATREYEARRGFDGILFKRRALLVHALGNDWHREQRAFLASVLQALAFSSRGASPRGGFDTRWWFR